MANQRILLTINRNLFGRLKKKAKSNFMSVQELINNILRKEILKESGNKK